MQSSKCGILLIADDFGMNKQRTDAIVAGRAFVSRTSLLVNGDDAERAAALGAVHNIPMGLHFNITEGDCVASTSQGTLLTQRGSSSFTGKASLLKCLTAIHIEGNDPLRRRAVEVIALELKAQLQRFVALTGRREVWVDGHHHVHVLPLVWEALSWVVEEERAMEGFDVPRIVGVRIPHDPTLASIDDTKFSSDEDCFGEVFWRKISKLAKDVRDGSTYSIPPHLCFPDWFIGFDFGGANCSAETLERKLKALLQAPGALTPLRWRPPRLPQGVVVIELMTHIGYAKTGGDVERESFLDEGTEMRQVEWDFYCSESFCRCLVSLDVSLLVRGPSDPHSSQRAS